MVITNRVCNRIHQGVIPKESRTLRKLVQSADIPYRGLLASVVFLTAMCTSFAAQADSSPDMNGELRRALYGVLAHSDLSDVDALSKSFDLGLHVLKPEGVVPEQKGLSRVRAIPTRSPFYLFASGLSYEAYVDAVARKTRIELRFVPRVCPKLDQIGDDWSQRVTHSGLIDAAGSVATIHWPVTEGIDLSFSYFGIGCSASLTQVKSTVVSFPKPPGIKQRSGAELVG
jgi:hypothetical protein